MCNLYRLDHFEDDLLSKDLRIGLGPFRRTARRYIRLVLLRLREDFGGSGTQKLDNAYLGREVARDYREQYGFNPLFFWILGVVINLVWQWWLLRDHRPGLAGGRSGAVRELQSLQEAAAREIEKLPW